MATVLQDLRYGIRILGTHPGFTAVALITLALGIGANTAVFSVLNGVLLKPLGYPEPDRLVGLFTAKPEDGMDRMTISYPDFLDWREQGRSFADMGIYDFRGCNFSGGERPERVLMVRASASLLPVLGYEARIGRAFGPAEEQPGEEHVVVLSSGFWHRRFGGESDVVGQSIVLDNVPYTILGVLPPDLERGWGRFDVWSPLSLDADAFGRGHRAFRAFGRLKPGAGVAEAQAEMTAIAARLEESYPEFDKGYTVNVVPVKEIVVGRAAGPAFTMLLAAAGFVLFIACANVVNLLLARISVRRKELAVRCALGAGTWRLVRQMVTECTLLTVAGGALGVVLALWSLDVLVAVLSDSVGRMDEVRVDWSVLLFALLLSLAVAVFLGLASALRSSPDRLAERLKEGAWLAPGAPTKHARRDLLIVAQVAMALALSVCAGLMVKSFLTLRAVDPGLETRRLLSMWVTLADGASDTDEQRHAFVDEVLRRVRAVPDVTLAAATTDLPLVDNDSASGVMIEEYLPAEPNASVFVGDSVVTPGYFATMGIPLLAGRDFTTHDTRDAPGAVIVSEYMARQFWPGQDPLGKRLKFDRRDSETPWLTVVGVAGNVRQISLTRGTRAETYRPFAQTPQRRLALVARTLGSPLAPTGAIQRAIGEVDPDLAVYRVSSMDDVIADNTRGLSSIAGLVVVFALMALILAGVGLYGVVTYAVSQRTHEIGIRMALGARAVDVLRLILARSALFAVIGLAAGIGLALLLGRVLDTFLYGVSPTDPIAFAGVGALTAAVGLIASYIPARRATKVDPVVALRHEVGGG